MGLNDYGYGFPYFDYGYGFPCIWTDQQYVIDLIVCDRLNSMW